MAANNGYLTCALNEYYLRDCPQGRENRMQRMWIRGWRLRRRCWNRCIDVDGIREVILEAQV